MLKLLLLVFTCLFSFSVFAESFIDSLNPFKQSTNVSAFCESSYDFYKTKDNFIPSATQLRIEIPGAPEKLQDGDLLNIVKSLTLNIADKNKTIADCVLKTNAKLQALAFTPVSGVVSYGATIDLAEEKARQNRLETQLSACNKLKDDQVCTKFDVDPANTQLIEDINKGMTKVSETDGCKCIKEVMRQAELWNPQLFDDQKRVTQSRMQEVIIQGFGKKFLNDYAANIEDIGFFQVNTAKFFGKDKESQVAAAKKYECSDVAQYESAINKKCEANGISQEEKQKRINMLFNSYGKTDANNSMPLEQRFSDLNKKIQLLDPSKPYNRQIHDQKRFGLAKKENTVIMLDQIIKVAASDKASKDKLVEMVSTWNAPADAVAEFMLDEAQKNPKAFTERYLTNTKLDPKFVKKVKEFVFSKKVDSNVKYKTFIEHIEVAMGLHPGIKAMMSDAAVFDKTIKEVAENKKTLTETLESTDEVLGQKFQERCGDLIEKLSEAACIKSKDLLGQVNGDDISALLKGNGFVENSKYELLLVCEAGDPRWTKKPFSDITMKNRYERSDLMDRLTNPANEQKNAFRRLHDIKDSTLQDMVESAVAQTKSERDQVKDKSLASNKYSSPGDQQTESRAEIISPTKSSEVASSFQEADSSMGMNANTNNFAAPMALPTSMITPAVAETKNDLKSEVRETLSNKDNQEKVDRLLSNTDNSSMRELLRLKEESLRNRQKILELTSENEKQKLKDLEDKIKLLETKKEQIAKTQVKEDNEEEVSSTRQRNSYRGPSRDIASLRPMDGGGTGGDFGTGGGSSGGSFGSASVSQSSRGNSAAARTSSSAGDRAGSDSSDSNYIVVSSSGVSQNQSIKSQEVSQELINLLSSSDPDLSSLKKLKDSGMLYKFKVMENGTLVEKEILVDFKMLNDDAKKLVEEKLAKKQHSQLSNIEHELVAAKRTHSFQALKIILGEQLKK